MLKKTKDSILLNKFLTQNVDLPFEEESKLVEQVLAKSPESSSPLLKFYIERAHKYKNELEDAQRELKAFSESPWFPGRCVTMFDSTPPMALVAIDNGRRAVVTVGQNVDSAKLVPGTPVLLNQKMNAILKVWHDLPLNCEVATFDRTVGNRIIVKTNGETDLILDLCDSLKNEDVHIGDSILFDRGSRIALEKIANGKAQNYMLEETPDVTFDDIGGLNDVVLKLVNYIDLHFFHDKIVHEHQLRPAKGILLVGPPGVGKTMIAKAIANYCASNLGNSGQCKFMNIPPGSQRHWYYGATEHNYRQIFATARATANENEQTRVVLFWDELDNVGRRGRDFSNGIDDRTMNALLVELDGLNSSDKILVVGATNREDLIDPGLRRSKRFGDDVFRLRRPDQDAAADIFAKYLVPGLPYYCSGHKSSASRIASDIIESAVSYLYAPNSPRARLASVTFRNGSKREISPRDVVSGAMIENIVRKAAYQSCIRALEGRGGITEDDVLNALDEELNSVSQQLKDMYGLRDWIEIDRDQDVMKVEIHSVEPESRPHRYLRSLN